MRIEVRILTMGIVTACAARLEAQGPYLAANLVGYWDFEDPNNLGKNTAPGGDGDLDPASGGTGVPTAVAGKIGSGAVDFNHFLNGGAWLEYNNGSGVPTNIPVGNSPYSIAVWVNIRTAATGPIGKPGFVSWGVEAPLSQNTFGFETADQNANVELQNWWNVHRVYQNISLPPYNFHVNTGWHHFGVNRDANDNTQALYIDGVQVPPLSFVPVPNIAAQEFRIGSGPDNLGPGNQMSMDGQLDDLSIWNFSLRETDFTALYNNGVGRPATDLLVPGLAGDYNNNGVVDGADYVVWRKLFPQAGPDAIRLPNDVIAPGYVDELDYLYWREHFGEVSGNGARASGAVPEPATLVLLVIGIGAVAAFGNRRRSGH